MRIKRRQSRIYGIEEEASGQRWEKWRKKKVFNKFAEDGDVPECHRNEGRNEKKTKDGKENEDKNVKEREETKKIECGRRLVGRKKEENEWERRRWIGKEKMNGEED